VTDLPVIDPRSWAVWRNSGPVVAFVLAVGLGAIACLLPLAPVSAAGLSRLGVLAVIAATTLLLCRRMERARRFLGAEDVPNLVATWTFAGALVLDHTSALVLVVGVYALQWPADRKVYAGRPHRYLYNAATVIIGVRCAQLVHGPLLAGAVLLIVNMALVVGVLTAAGNPGGIRRLGDLREQALEVLTLGLGWIAASLFEWHALATVAVLPVVVTVQYVALRRAVTQPSTIDPESGALTIRAWNALGALRLAQVAEAIVLQVTPAAPDAVGWAQCGAGVRSAVRPEDLVGRTADGFVVLVAGPGGDVLAQMLALQMRARLAVNGIDTYVGFAMTPDRGKPVDLQGLAVTASADVIVRAADIHV
jgi:hypothetical protein